MQLGEYLAQARRGKALDRAVCARRLGVSVRQLEEIEEGGLGAFSNEQHKLLAMREYAALLSLEWSRPTPG